MTADPRGCPLYEFTVWDPHTKYTAPAVGYIGESNRLAATRHDEHADDKPWFDTVVSYRVVGYYPNKAAVQAAEKAAVQNARPLYNVEYNKGNPRRITREKALQQRLARDDAAGRARWQPTTTGAARPARRQPASTRPAVRTGKRATVPRPVPGARLIGLLTLWALGVAGFWWAAGDQWGTAAPRNAAVASGVVVGLAAFNSKKRRRRRRR